MASSHTGNDGAPGSCPLIAKYPGKCRYCAKPIEVGRDEYDLDTKTSFHVDCRDNQPPGPEAFALAEHLGFVNAADVEHTSFVRICEDWAVRNLSKNHAGETAGRPRPDTRGRNGILWEQ